MVRAILRYGENGIIAGCYPVVPGSSPGIGAMCNTLQGRHTSKPVSERTCGFESGSVEEMADSPEKIVFLLFGVALLFFLGFSLLW